MLRRAASQLAPLCGRQWISGEGAQVISIQRVRTMGQQANPTTLTGCIACHSMCTATGCCRANQPPSHRARPQGGHNPRLCGRHPLSRTDAPSGARHPPPSRSMGCQRWPAASHIRRGHSLLPGGNSLGNGDGRVWRCEAVNTAQSGNHATGPALSRVIANDRYLWSVAPCLLAWPAVVMPQGPAALVVGATLLGCYLVDRKWAAMNALPRWYMSLRAPLTAAAVTGMALTVWASGFDRE